MPVEQLISNKAPLKMFRIGFNPKAIKHNLGLVIPSSGSCLATAVWLVAEFI